MTRVQTQQLTQNMDTLLLCPGVKTSGCLAVQQMMEKFFLTSAIHRAIHCHGDPFIYAAEKNSIFAAFKQGIQIDDENIVKFVLIQQAQRILVLLHIPADSLMGIHPQAVDLLPIPGRTFCVHSIVING